MAKAHDPSSNHKMRVVEDDTPAEGAPLVLSGRMTDRVGKTRMRQTILERASYRFSSEDEAKSWYVNVPIPGYGNLTARHLVDGGHGDWVLEFLNNLGNGSYA